ncbi:hypothetical protein HK101_003161 [Irineochytrium annulatum]|nr:hypothetical protein HK101_003161 [Irineochytrium annulatum]
MPSRNINATTRRPLVDSDVLGLILSELQPNEVGGFRALYSCLLVSRCFFEIAAARSWAGHFAFYATEGIGPATAKCREWCEKVCLAPINQMFVALRMPGKAASQALASSATDVWRDWRWGVYIRSINILYIDDGPNKDPCVWADADMDPEAASLFGRIRVVIVQIPSKGSGGEGEDGCKVSKRAGVADSPQEGWLGWIKRRLASRDGPSHVIYEGKLPHGVLDYAQFRVTTLTIAAHHTDVTPILIMIVNNTAVRNLRFESDEDVDVLRTWLRPHTEIDKARFSSLRQLQIKGYSAGELTLPRGFLTHFESLTHLYMSSPVINELERSANTLTHLTLPSFRRDTEASYIRAFASLSRLVNPTLLVLHLPGRCNLPPDARPVLVYCLARLTALRLLEVKGQGWQADGLSEAVAGMTKLRSLNFDFVSSNDEGDSEDDDDVDFEAPVDGVILNIRARRLSHLIINGAHDIVIEDADEIVRDGWYQLQIFAVWWPRAGDVWVPDSLTARWVRDVMFDERLTPSLKLATWEDEGGQTCELRV